MTGPLDGVRVIDLTRLLPGAYCTLVLAELGADVVKIEDPGGGDLMRTLPPQVDGLSVYHHALNRNKRSVTLDLRAAEAAPVLDRLLDQADVVIESFRPRTARRLKVTADDLRPRHPRLVHCSLTGFGQEGPYAERAAHDLDFVALAGLFEIDQPRSTPAEPLHVPRLLVADIGSAWAAVAGIAAALFRRERTGGGSAVDIAIYDVAASWLTFPAAAATMRPAGPSHPLPVTGDAACYNVYQTADGRHVVLAAIEQKFWQTFCERVGRPDFVAVQFVPGEQPGLRAAIAEIVRSRTLGDWLAMFGDVDICLAPVRTIADALSDQHLVFRGAIASRGDSRFIRTPIVFRASDGPGHVARLPVVPASPLGVDTDAVLGSAGFSRAQIGDLRARRVV